MRKPRDDSPRPGPLAALSGLALAAVFLAGIAHAQTTSDSPSHQGDSPIGHVQRLVSDGHHNAFTDLIRWRDHIYLTYRRSSGHAQGDGDIVLLRSEDGREWEQIDTGLQTTQNFYEGWMIPFRGKLFMYGGGFTRDGLNKRTMREYVSVSEDGVNWSPAQQTHIDLWRFWKPIQIGEQLYVAAYHADRDMLGAYAKGDPRRAGAWTVVLLRSDDGMNWEPVSTLAENLGGGETALVTESDGTLRAFVRCQTPPFHTFEMRSTAPYETWSGPIDCGEVIQGAHVERVDGRLFTIGRHLPCNSRNLTSVARRDQIRAKIWVEEMGYWVDYGELPSGGDCGYAAILPLGDHRMLVSYYSQHAYINESGFEDTGGASDLYIVEVRTDARPQWGRVALPGQQQIEKFYGDEAERD